jgi:ornithine cyclodeaminase
MPAAARDPAMIGSKVISVFPANTNTPYDSHQGVVLLFESQHGRLRAVLDASEITTIRTAAVSAVATDLLAREDAQTLAILGSGVQAHSHLEAMLLCRPIRTVRVFSPTQSGREHFARTASKRWNVDVRAVDSAQAAVASADIVCTVSSSREPILEADWLGTGVHINAVGACTPATRELDTATVVRSRLFTDRTESLLHEAGDYLIPRSEGAITDAQIAGELGDVLTKRRAGRRTEEEWTLFKSLGIAIEDVACAHYLYEAASQARLGTSVEFGGSRELADR